MIPSCPCNLRRLLPTPSSLRIPAALVVAFLTAGAPVSGSASAPWRYVSPVPNATRVSPQNTVAIRPGDALDAASLRDDLVVVSGAASGLHPGSLVLSDDGMTLVFRPATPFALRERVSVTLRSGIRTRDGAGVPGGAFGFMVGAVDPAAMPRRALCGIQEIALAPGAATWPPPDRGPATAVPAGYPPIEVTTIDDPEPGCLFFAPFVSGGGGHLVILDNRGEPVFYRQIRFPALDFKQQPNGLLTWFSGQKFYAMNDTGAIVDSFLTGNGYQTDVHDLRILPNDHVLLMSYDPQPVGMDTVVAGGDPDATVIGLILQEIDGFRNVVFQWRSWDHFDITDCAVPGGESLTDSVIDYVHGNSIELDDDGNILLSSRHLQEVTKIDRTTGDVIWRMGLNALRNEFQFIDDDRGYSYQHDARRLDNGHITVFDNGNLHDPAWSAGLEYAVDETAKTAQLVWSYRHDPEMYSVAMGNLQRLPGGGSVLGWGVSLRDNLTEIHPDGSTAYELSFNPWFTYRAFRFPWRTAAILAHPDSVDFGTVAEDDTAWAVISVENPGLDDLVLTSFTSTKPAFTVLDPPPVTITSHNIAALLVRYVPRAGLSEEADIYLTSLKQTEVVSRVIHVSGTGAGEFQIGVPDGGDASPRLLGAAPNPFRASTTVAFSLAEPAPVRLRVFDAAGALVRTLLDRPFAGGHHRVTWDGRDDAGRPVGAGIYFCALEGGGVTLTRRLVRVR